MSSSIFGNDRSLRSQFAERDGTELQSATTVATAIRLTKLKQDAKAFYLENGLNVDVILYLVRPFADDSVAAERSMWLKLGSGKTLNLELASVNLLIDSGSYIYASCASAPTNTANIKLRLFTWG